MVLALWTGPSHCTCGWWPNQDGMMSGQTKIGFMQLQLGGMEPLEDFDPNVLWQCFSSCFSARLSHCPVRKALPSQIKIAVFNIVQKQLTNTSCLWDKYSKVIERTSLCIVAFLTAQSWERGGDGDQHYSSLPAASPSTCKALAS